MSDLIPAAALSQHIAVLGKTGSGKTFAIKGIVEELLEQRRRVCIVDPTGAWWGLRSSADGNKPGFDVLVLGGDHGDLPLPALGGAAVARLVSEQSVNLIADTAHLTVGERTRWFTDFASTLYRVNRAPLHLILDEAHNFAPQGKVPDPDTGKMLHAANTLASGGRSRGIRLAMITQRPQKLHKDALTSADTLIAMRVLAPQDRLAVEDWIKGCGDLTQGKEVLNSLASLQRGEGWVWYPEGGYLKRAKFPAICTFDSSATPTDGHASPAPKRAAEIDMKEIKAALADAVKEAEANDPKLLRKRIAELEREAGKPREVAVDTASLEQEFERGRSDGFDAGRLAGYSEAIAAVRGTIDKLNATLPVSDARPASVRAHLSAVNQWVPPKPVVTREPRAPANGDLSKAERKVLTALAQYPNGRAKNQIAVLTAYAVNGGGFNNAISACRSRGYLEGGQECMRITQSGIDALGSYDPLPSGRALRDHWMHQLGKAERAVLIALCEVYPRGLSKDELGTRTNYEPNGGGFNNALSRLRTLELISGRGELKASDDLF